MGHAVAASTEHRPERRSLDHLLCRDRERRLDERDLYDLPEPRPVPLLEGEAEGEDRVCAAEGIADPPHDQREVVVARDPGEAAHLFDGHREAGAVLPWAIEAERGHANVDRPRVHGPDALGVESQGRHDPRREVLDHDVGLADQTFQQGEAVLVVELQRDVALPRIHAVEDVRPLPEDLVPDRRREAHAVGPLDRLDLDHVRAEIREDRCRVGARPERGQIDDS